MADGRVVRVALVFFLVLAGLLVLHLPAHDAAARPALSAMVQHSANDWSHLPSSAESARGEGKDAGEERCAGSEYGRALVVDRTGRVCAPREAAPGGCCRASAAPFNCSSCRADHCCALYENCVACCLRPQHRVLVQFALEAVPYKKLLAETTTDIFSACQAKCRTSSQSVQHENKYRDEAAKYCYGPKPAPLVPTDLK